jgi:hypothetical protein
MARILAVLVLIIGAVWASLTLVPSPQQAFLAAVDHRQGFEYDSLSRGYLVCAHQALGDEAFLLHSDPGLVEAATDHLC